MRITKVLTRDFDSARQTLASRLRGLTDDECFWQPVDEVWTVHVDESGVATPDFVDLAPYPPPFTTIAWRLSHIGQSLMFWADRHFEDGSFSHDNLRWPATAEESIGFVEEGCNSWRGGLLSVDGNMDEEKFIQLSSQANHLRQHGAEIGVIRDLYWHTQRQEPFAAACLKGDREVVEQVIADNPAIVEETKARLPGLLASAGESGGVDAMNLLIDLGFSVKVNGQRSPLHQAVALGDLELVRRIVELGADVSAVDTTYNSTPLGWAEFFGNSEIAEYLGQR